MKNMNHPNFILAVVSMIMLLIGVYVKASGYKTGDYLILTSVGLGAIHWIVIAIERSMGSHAKIICFMKGEEFAEFRAQCRW